MKHIVKNPEPAELLIWKATNGYYKAGHPKWKSIPSATKEIVREAMRDEQGHICCYCERYLQTGDYHIEHIKPKGPTSPYRNLLAEYDNLLCSCQHESAKGDPLHCGMGKGNWYDPVDYVSPLDPGCETRFKYTYDGFVEGTDSGARTTITNLKLDLPKLNRLRKRVIEPFLDLQDELSAQELSDFIQGYLRDKEHNDGEYGEFYTTIKFLFAHHI